MVPKNTLSLSDYRLSYKPPLPSILQDLNRISAVQQPIEMGTNKELEPLFPCSYHLPPIYFVQKKVEACPPLKVGVVFSGGPAPGGHNVLSGLFDALNKLNSSSQLIGFLNGPDGMIRNQTKLLTDKIIDSFRNQGGFDCLGTGRTKMITPEQFERVESTLRALNLDGLVIIGGDDSNTNGAFLAEFCLKKKLSTRIIGIPKTIDGDLKNAFIEAPFGFDTASKVYSEIIGNLLRDALSQKKYYFFVKMMGRSSSHLTLECALKTQVNLALIGEEIEAKKETLKNVVDQIADLICARADINKNYGVILIPEGVLDLLEDCNKMIGEINRFFEKRKGENGTPFEELKKELSSASFECLMLIPQEIQRQLLLDRDAHGNIQFSKIETERVLISLVEKELKERKEYKGNFNPQPMFCGYEGRCALPTNFDCSYTYTLGHIAALLIRDNATGYICSVKNLAAPHENWQIFGAPIVKMLHFEERNQKQLAVIKKSLVDLQGPVFLQFKREREKWQLGDVYLSPGPIQFEGPDYLADMITNTLTLESQFV